MRKIMWQVLAGLLCGLAISTNIYAQDVAVDETDEPTATATATATSATEDTSRRSKTGNMYWVSANGGFDPLGNNLFPSEFRTDLTMRFQFSRYLGLLINYHDGWVDSRPRHGSATAHNSIWGIGPSAVVAEIGKHSRFLHNSFILAFAQFQYGHTSYKMTALDSNDKSFTLAEGSQNRSGFATGADLFVPVYFGFWANAGLGFESNGFDYPSKYEPRGDTLDLPASLPYVRVGLAYSF